MDIVKEWVCSKPYLFRARRELNSEIRRYREEFGLDSLRVYHWQDHDLKYSFESRSNYSKRIHLGSCAKPLAAFIIHELIAQGKLTLETDAMEILNVKYIGGTSIGDLLTHKAKLPTVHLDYQWDRSSDRSAEAARNFRIKMANEMHAWTNIHQGYNNLNYVILTAVIEYILEKNIEEICREKFGVDPFGFPFVSFDRSNDEPIMVAGNLVASSYQFDNPRFYGLAGVVSVDIREVGAIFGKIFTQEESKKMFEESGSDFNNYGLMNAKLEKLQVATLYGSNTLTSSAIIIEPKNQSIMLLSSNLTQDKIQTFGLYLFEKQNLTSMSAAPPP